MSKIIEIEHRRKNIILGIKRKENKKNKKRDSRPLARRMGTHLQVTRRERIVTNILAIKRYKPERHHLGHKNKDSHAEDKSVGSRANNHTIN